MEETKIYEEQDNSVEETSVACVEANEAKNNDFVVGAAVGVLGTMFAACVIKLVKGGINKAKEKNEAKKQAQNVQDAEFTVLETTTEESED